MDDDPWPGGRTRLLNGTYLPRYLTKICPKQQAILEACDAWQPSKADRQIRGSIPNLVLTKFTDLADERAGMAIHLDNLDQEGLLTAQKLSEDVQPGDHKELNISEMASTSSDTSDSLGTTWSPTPRSPARSRPPFPDTSSPLRPPQRPKAICSSPGGDRSVGALDISGQEQDLENTAWESSPDNRIEHNLEECLQEQKGPIAPCGKRLTDIMPTAPDFTGSDPEIMKSRFRTTIECDLNSAQEQVQVRDTISMAAFSNHPKSDQASSQADSPSFRFQTQLDPLQQKPDGTGQVQVQRTPFGHAFFTLIKEAVLADGHSGPHTSDGGQAPHDQEARSSPSVVLGTFADGEVKQRRDSEGLGTKNSCDDLIFCRNEPARHEGRRDTHNSANPAEAGGAISQYLHAAVVGGRPVLEERSQKRGAKRRHQNDGGSSSKRSNSDRLDKAGDMSASMTQWKRRRTTGSVPSVGGLGDFKIADTASMIARESRRELLRDRQRRIKNGSLALASPAVSDYSQREPGWVGSGSIGRQRSLFTQSQGDNRPRTSMNSSSGFGEDIIEDMSSSLGRGRRSLFEDYRRRYTDYQGNAGQFYRACKQIKILQREGKAPHPSLWDDFIFRRHHDYPGYLWEIAEAGDDPLGYLQYYMEHVEKPSRMQLIVTQAYISSLEVDSSLGSSVDSSRPRPLADTNEIGKIGWAVAERAAAAASIQTSSRLSDRNARQDHMSVPKRGENGGEYDLDVLQQQERVKQRQVSSVKRWVELQTRERPSGAASPELGSADLASEGEAIDELDLKHREGEGQGQGGGDADGKEQEEEGKGGSSSARPWPRGCEQQKVGRLWSDDRNTPFKSFARFYTALACERRQLREAVQVDDMGCVKPQLQGGIDTFTPNRQ